jgi:hypothetical protein
MRMRVAYCNLHHVRDNYIRVRARARRIESLPSPKILKIAADKSTIMVEYETEDKKRDDVALPVIDILRSDRPHLVGTKRKELNYR